MQAISIKHWFIWLLFSLALAGGLYYQLDVAADKTALMPGPLSDGHHQFADKCETCHATPFGGSEVLEQRCMDCHGDVREKPNDSHPKNKFKDPRNADLLTKINALSCITCHAEHKPEITQKNGLTQPTDFCIHCHADIGAERESHTGMAFDSCTNAGCHNFHNNRAIYTDFLVKHLDEADLLAKHQIKPREFAEVLDSLAEYPHANYPVQSLKISDADMPASVSVTQNTLNDWAASGHAKSGVNCTACHSQTKDEMAWSDTVDYAACQSCHALEIDRFQQGKHGMRLEAELPTMQVRDARLPMHKAAAHDQLACNSCHGAHRYDTQQAAVEACVECHADEHTQAYQDSPHAQHWQAELSGAASANSGVSCATCHMPRVSFDVNDWVTRIMVDHNQSANLSPNSKMARSVCMHCHGLDFSLKALADPEQIKTNFAFSPLPDEHPSMQLAREDNERYLRETRGNQSN